MGYTYTTICLRGETKERLKDARLFERESFDAVINRWGNEAEKVEAKINNGNGEVKDMEVEEATYADEEGNIWDTKTGQLLIKGKEKELTADEEIKKYSDEVKDGPDVPV